MKLKDRLGLAGEPVFLMDGTAYIYRSFYAQRHLQRSDGFPTNAIVIVTRMLLKILRQEEPKYFLFVMDGKGKNFRSVLYPEYKANREKMPEDLIQQIEPVSRMVDALGIKREVAADIEADDCIASLAFRLSRDNPIIIISGDKDLKQCLAPNIFMWDPGAKEEKIITIEEFTAETGVSPSQWPDMQALIGDSSDNIPGVAGIGPKTAMQIFQTCPNLEAITSGIDKLPPKLQDKLRPGLEKMYLWRELTTLRRDACPELTLNDLIPGKIDLHECGKLADEFELAAVRREIARLAEPQNRQNLLQPEARPIIGEQEFLPAAQSIDHVGNAPDCSGKKVAVIWPSDSQGQPHVALEDAQDWLWKDSMANLCKWLSGAKSIIVSDLKELLVKYPSWQNLYFRDNYRSFMDLGLASYLLNPEDGDYSWQRIASRWRDSLDIKNPQPATLALMIAEILEKNLVSNSMEQLYRQLELPLVGVLARMELNGFAISPAAFQLFLGEVDAQANTLEANIFKEAGTSFNLRSSQQLGEILFDKIKLPAPKRTKSGQYATSQLILEKLSADYKIVEDILEFRKLDKLRSTYLAPLPRLMDKDGRIHSTFNQEATATGRLSSSNPNLQNIPVKGVLGARMRTCFVAPPGKSLVTADYSQIELRLLAHFSQDPTLLDAFKNGEDIHGKTAALVFDMPQSEISHDQRRMAKTINFGLLYGMGAQKLSQELKISQAQAKDFIARYFARLSRVREFFDSVLTGAREHGYVSTLTGRRRWLPGIFSENGHEAAQAQRQAINAVIQGTAADVIKMAMLAVSEDEFLKKHDAKLVLQVHDELLLEVPEEIAQDAGQIVANIMESAAPAKLSVPLLVDWGTGPNWGVAH